MFRGRWLKAQVRRFTSAPPPDFDPNFYRAGYPDLAGLSDRRLAVHYKLWGRDEGRRPNRKALLADAEALGDPLDPDFDPVEYLLCNPDLRRRGLNADQAIIHYLGTGRREGRSFRPFNQEIYRELYFPKQIISDEALRKNYEGVGRSVGRIGTAAAYLAERGFPNAHWADSIDLDAFALLNWSWAGEVTSRLQAIDLMLDAGIDRMAPLGFDLMFEPAYYRDAHPDLAHLADCALYRHWLSVDFAFRPGSALQHLRWLGLDLLDFPSGFDWRRYAARHRGLATRWSALDHLVRGGLAARSLPPLTAQDPSRFLTALSQTVALADDAHAVMLLEQAKTTGADPQAIQWLGDCCFRLGRWDEAYEAYEEVSRTPECSVWTICNGAKAAIALERPDLALALVRRGADNFNGDVNWRQIAHETLRAEFQQCWTAAESCYLAHQQAQGDRIMETAVDVAASRWREFDPLGLPLATNPNGPVVILANVDLAQCTHYRVTQKAELLEALHRPYAIFGQDEVDDFLTALPGAGLAIFYRLPATPDNIRAIDTARAIGVPTFYEIDDLIFDPAHYPEPIETYGGGVSAEFYATLQLGVPLFRAAMARCDYGLASTAALAKHMESVVRTGKTFVVPNGLDSLNEGFLTSLPARSRRDDAFVIFYGSGTKAHNSDFLDLAGPALLQVMQRYPHVQLVTAGYLTLDERFDAVRDRIIIADWTNDLASYWSMLAEVDLNIAVLTRHPTTDPKSEIKWVEAAALGVPSVVSATDRYLEVLDDGADVLIAHDADEWTKALERMVVDPQLRSGIVARAREKLSRLYTVEANAMHLDAVLAFASTLHRPRAQGAGTKPKKRVLLVNLFFPPQTIGGSTRVLRDNLDHFLDSNDAEDLEFAVVTTDLGVQTPYRMRLEEYRGVPVFRISTPSHLHMEWRPFNPKLGVLFTEVLELWRPDLVHFHCVQRLTASIVDACRRHGTPYINTLHDAWWISDWQFLTDDRDRIRSPDEPWPVNPPSGHTLGEAVARRTALQPLLKDSAEILGVSQAFTEMHRRCGFEAARCVPNGAPPMAKAVARPSVNGKVRLAHVGSQTRFKGYDLVQAALMQGDFPNLELTVVEHARFGGARRREVWGSTAVAFVGKTKQERMHEFYAGIDVLLAPSVWPESFGLVSREALCAGLWVVASDRGAMGEDVTSGVNGWVIDVGSPGPLIEVFREIDQAPERFRVSPPAANPPLRQADDQAQDLLAIYHEVLQRPASPGLAAKPSNVTRLKMSRRAEEHHTVFRRGFAAALSDQMH